MCNAEVEVQIALTESISQANGYASGFLTKL